MKTLIIGIILTFSATADFLEEKIIQYSSKNCSNEFSYRISELQIHENYAHYIYSLKDKTKLTRHNNYNNAVFSFDLSKNELIEVTCPAKLMLEKGQTHHYEKEL